MTVQLKVPAIGESITEVVVGQILKKEGDFVRLDEEILELESDKVNQVLVAPATGRLSLQVRSGQTVPIGFVLGSIEPSEAAAAAPAGSPPREEKRSERVSPGSPERSGPAASTVAGGLPDQAAGPSSTADLRIQTAQWLAHPPSSAAVSAAPSLGEREIPAWVNPLGSVPAGTAPCQSMAAGEPSEERRPMSKMRQTIARRLVETQQTTASLTTFNECDMSAVTALRVKYKELFQKEHGIGLGFMSFFMKAVVDALQHYPDLNAYIDGQDIVRRKQIDLSIAVSTDRGLVVPVIRQAQRKSFAELEAELAALAEQARAGQLKLEQMQGGGFTITNAGVFGSLLSTPILNAPQVGILGMHRILPRPVAVGDRVEIRPMMYLALTYDHRIVDGKEAVSFLVHVKQMIEDPARLLLEV